MDIVTILRDLMRAKLLVAGVCVLALLAGAALNFKLSFPPSLESRKYEVGVATARILVDTPRSQVVDVAPEGSDSLGVRANLLASLMVDGLVKTAIARRADLPPEKLIVHTEAATAVEPMVTTPTRDDYVLTTRVVTNTGGDELPIIEVEAQAPTRAAAASLGGAAVEGLRDYLDTKAAAQAIPNADRLQVTGLGAPSAATVVRGPGPILAVVATLFVFGLGCGLILLVAATRRSFRAANEREAGAVAAIPATPVQRAPAKKAGPRTSPEAAPEDGPAPRTPSRPKLVSTAKPEPASSWFADPPRHERAESA